MSRYTVSPIADEHCNSLTEEIILETSDLKKAKKAAERSNAYFGAGIFDNELGLLDVGFGFDIPCEMKE